MVGLPKVAIHTGKDQGSRRISRWGGPSRRSSSDFKGVVFWAVPQHMIFNLDAEMVVV